MDDIGMQVDHGLRDVDGHLDDQIGLHRPAPVLLARRPVQLAVQRSALSQLLDNTDIRRDGTCRQKRDDVGMPEPRQDGNLLAERVHLPAVGGVGRLEDLDGHRMSTPLAFEDGPKRAGAELLVEDHVLGEIVRQVVDGRGEDLAVLVDGRHRLHHRLHHR